VKRKARQMKRQETDRKVLAQARITNTRQKMRFCLTVPTIVVILISSCISKDDSLSNTKWTYHYSENYQDYYFFKGDGNYEFYSAELGDTLFGTYSISVDTIRILQKFGSHDREFDSDSRHRIGESEYSLLIKDGRIGLLENYSNGEWNTDYLFVKK
jgi:hypothetical protein